jgi:hypothetical protein
MCSARRSAARALPADNGVVAVVVEGTPDVRAADDHVRRVKYGVEIDRTVLEVRRECLEITAGHAFEKRGDERLARGIALCSIELRAIEELRELVVGHARDGAIEVRLPPSDLPLHQPGEKAHRQELTAKIAAPCANLPPLRYAPVDMTKTTKSDALAKLDRDALAALLREVAAVLKATPSQEASLEGHGDVVTFIEGLEALGIALERGKLEAPWWFKEL